MAGAKCQIIMKHAVKEDMKERLDLLSVQGQLHHLVDDAAASLWSEVVQKLSPECMKFALPYNANLSMQQ